MKFMRICNWPVSKVLFINSAMQMKMCHTAHQKVVRPAWIYSQYSMKLTRKLQAYLFVRITPRMQSSQSLVGEDSGYNADCSQWMPTVRLCSQVCKLWTADQVAFYMWQAFFMPLPFPSVDCIWRWGIVLIQFTAKFALSLYNGPCPSKEFHSTHMFSNSPVPHVNQLQRSLL